MKKLRNKVFLVIFSLLTVFTFILFATTTVRSYYEKKNSIMDILTKMPMMDRKDKEINRNINRDKDKEPDFVPMEQPNNDSRKIFLDFTIYSVVLDDDGNYKEVINNTNNDSIDEDSVKKIAEDIISNHTDNLYIGNLYTSKYAYCFTPNNMLIIMDNSEINSTLLSGLVSNILLFVLCESLILFITYFITKWITNPVKASFEKQKVFVADASHELKTPLSVMIASADAYFNDKDEKWVHNMKSESERMIKLVTELLDLAKTEEEQEILLENKNLSDIIEGAILTFESLFYDNNIKLKYDIEPNINYLCNENLIIDLMSILIDNAIKHCSDKKKVFVNLSKKNKQIILEVKNTGLPIKKEDEEKIFERFYKVDSSRNRNSNNYGLGLAIAKNIVLKHNGEISAHSSDGYTTFKVILNQK